MFILIFALLGTFSLYHWGFFLQMGLLVYVLTIIMSGILIGSTAALVVTVILTTSLILIAFGQAQGGIKPNLYWQYNQGAISDAIVFSGTFVIISVVMWLSNREIEQSLDRAKDSEQALRRQRDVLEKEVEERTRQLQKIQLERMTQLYRSAELGRLTAGLFHDLVNPLGAISLNLQQADVKKRSRLLNQARVSLKKLEGFIQATQQQVRKRDDIRTFDLTEEIEQVVQMLHYKALENQVVIKIEIEPGLKLHGNANKFFQIIINLISNAIDAYKGSRKANKKVTIQASRTGSEIKLLIADRATGINPEHLKKIFDPFFTTKAADQGTGIGLSIAQNIATKDFHGSLSVDSHLGRGSVFTLTLPITKPDI